MTEVTIASGHQRIEAALGQAEGRGETTVLTRALVEEEGGMVDRLIEVRRAPSGAALAFRATVVEEPHMGRPFVATVTCEAFRQIEAELLAQGWLPKAPGQAGVVDGPIARLARCPTCGRPMAYAPLLSDAPRGYRAFAVCRPCDLAEEF